MVMANVRIAEGGLGCSSCLPSDCESKALDDCRWQCSTRSLTSTSSIVSVADDGYSSDDEDLSNISRMGLSYSRSEFMKVVVPLAGCLGRINYPFSMITIPGRKTQGCQEALKMAMYRWYLIYGSSFVETIGNCYRCFREKTLLSAEDDPIL